MIFNTTFLYALTISSYYDHSPLLMIGPSGKGSNFQMKEFKLSNFFNNALKVNYLIQNISIDSSKFSNFLDTAIVVRSQDEECDILPTKTFINMQIVLARCVNATNTTFENNANIAFKYGGAINCILTQENHYFYVDRCNFTYCRASTKGGAIYFVNHKNCTQYNSITYCNFLRCFVYKNLILENPQLTEDEECQGGSVYCDASYVNFRNSIFNLSQLLGDGRGGAVYAKVISIDNYTFFTQFINCQAIGDNTYGGALYIDLDEEGPYNMSYMTFEKCQAANGECVYAQNISRLNINYTEIINNAGSLLRVDDLNFNFTIGSIMLQNSDNVKLVTAENSTNYNGPRRKSFYLYADPPFGENSDESPLFDNDVINYCFIYIRGTGEYKGIPVVPPENAQLPLEDGEYIDPPPDQTGGESSPESESSPTDEIPPIEPPPLQPTNEFSQSNTFTAAAAAGGGGLSTVAIIFIVLACLIVVIAIIIFVIFYLRSHGRCLCSKDDSLAGMKSSTYF